MVESLLTKKILIADSNIDYSKYLQDVLKEKGFLSYIASSYEEAYSLSHDKIPDIILVDYMLPYGGAIHLTEKIKSDNLLKNTPIIYLATNTNKTTYLNVFDAGGDGLLSKYIDTDILVARIKAFLRQKALLEDNAKYITMLKKDIEYAAKLQKTILSYGNTKIPRNDLSVYHFAPNEVSGDISGIKNIGENLYAILLADVSGHGVTASILTILIKSFFDNNSVVNNKIVEPSDFIKRLNTFFISENFDENLFATVIYALYNNETGLLTFSSAGSPKPFLYNAKLNTVESIEIEGPLVGIENNSVFPSKTLEIKRNDTILIFTDGAYEVFDESKNMFGEEALKELFYKLSKEDIKKLPKSIISKLREFSSEGLQDDISMIALKRID